LDNSKDAFKGGDNGPGIVPGEPEKSRVYTSTSVSPEDERLMPPKKKGGPLPKEHIETLLNWIQQGAVWPDGITLVPRKPEEAPGANEAVTVADIHKMILERKSSVIIVTTIAAARAAQQVTPATPIVMTGLIDPVGVGLIASLARPGNNTTGISNMIQDTSAKGLELIREVAPTAKTIAALFNPNNPGSRLILEDVRSQAAKLGMTSAQVLRMCAALWFAALESSRTDLVEVFGQVNRRRPTSVPLRVWPPSFRRSCSC
jgi:hypothetical protein